MMSRRDALASFALFAEFIATARDAGAQAQPAPPQSPRPPLIKKVKPNLSLEGWEVNVSHEEYAPGRVGAPHQHAGFVLAYVLEGKVVAKVSGQGPERTYSVGEMFYEQPGAVHEVSRNASQTEPAKLLAMIFARKGATLTTPVPTDGRP